MTLKKIPLLTSLTALALLGGCSTVDHWFGTHFTNDQQVVNQPTQTPAAPAVPQAPARTSTKAPTSKSSLVIYLSSRSAQEGYTLVEQKGQSIYVDPRHTLLRSDLDNVIAVQDSNNNPLLNLHFSTAGQEKLRQITSNNVGKALTVTYKGGLVSIINISKPLTQGQLFVPMGSAAEAGRLEQSILDGD